MFQRLKGAIDSRIAEEQARQRPLQASPSRSNSVSRRTPRSGSPAVRNGRNRSIENEAGDTPAQGPDPKEFEAEFVIADEEAPSRAATPQPQASKGNDNDDGKALVDKSSGSAEITPGAASQSQSERSNADTGLPTEVRVKLRKLERLETRYQELLRSYRIAHARVSAIEPFEASLRENTPLTSINDPGALVEYLNQVNLKGDMVLDELKRVSNERETFKQSLAQAEKKAKEAWDEVTRLMTAGGTSAGPKEVTVDENGPKSLPTSPQETSEKRESLDSKDAERSAKSPPISAKSKSPSIPGLSLFSPKPKPADTPPIKEESEEFFSYDSELPRLEAELKQSQEEVSTLRNEVKSLEGDLAVARESTQSMVQTLEESTREVSALRDRNEKSDADLSELRASSEAQVNDLRAQLEAADGKLHQLENQGDRETAEKLRNQKALLEDAQAELERMRDIKEKNDDAANTASRLQSELDALIAETTDLKSNKKESAKRTSTLESLVCKLRDDLDRANSETERFKGEADRSVKMVEKLNNELQEKVEQECKGQLEPSHSADKAANSEPVVDASKGTESGPGKKKNKKKKKGGKGLSEKDSTFQQPAAVQIPSMDRAGEHSPSATTENDVKKLQDEIGRLNSLLEEKNLAIENLQSKTRSADELKEEIETLRDDLLNIGQEHVEAKDKIKELQSEKAALESRLSDLEQELANLHTTHASSTAGQTKEHLDLTKQFEELKLKAADLQTDLTVAQQLASSRFKDLTELRSVLQKAQRELISLRTENGELKALTDELNSKVSDLQKIEARHDSLRTEFNDIKIKASERDSEIRSLTQRLSQESNTRQRTEERLSKTSQDLQKAENEKSQANQALGKTSSELAKSKEELNTLKGRVCELEESLSRTQRDCEGLKEDIELKTAQYVSAESLMSSMRDQTVEMATQTKEARDRCESLEEEVADAHRLLSERNREAETMRRLLAEVEGRSDSRIREMKDRMDTAIEERDKAEDEASTMGRRRVRELEEVRTKLRDAEKNLKHLEEEKDELVSAQRDWRKRREDLEQRSEQSTKEVQEVRKAMSSLRDALDDSEREARALEKQKVELRRTAEDAQQRLDKLQKSHKVMADEMRSIQSRAKANDSLAQSPRSSLDSGAPRSKATSPAPKDGVGAAINSSSTGQTIATTDYLKNILLQFLEQKDKKHQMQLIPVLGMLLHFDRKDEQKWMAAITSR